MNSLYSIHDLMNLLYGVLSLYGYLSVGGKPE